MKSKIIKCFNAPGLILTIIKKGQLFEVSDGKSTGIHGDSIAAEREFNYLIDQYYKERKK